MKRIWFGNLSHYPSTNLPKWKWNSPPEKKNNNNLRE